MDILTFGLVILSALMHAAWNLMAKRYSGNYSIIYLSFVVGWLLGLPWALANLSATTDWVASGPIILLTGLCHAVYGYMLNITYRHGDISTLYPLLRGTGVALAVTVAVLAFGESLGRVAALGMVLAFAGVALVSYRRDRSTTGLRGIISALLCGALIGSYTVLDKLAVQHVHPIVLLNATQLISGLVFLPYVLNHRRQELVHTVTRLWRPVAMISVVALLSYAIILHVFTYAPLSRVTVAREVSVAFGAIGGHLIFKESFSRSRLVGVVLVLMGIMLIRW